MAEYDDIDIMEDEFGTNNKCIVQRSLNGDRYTWVGPILLYVINYDNPDHIDDESLEEMETYASLMEQDSIEIGSSSRPCIENFVDRTKYRMTEGISKRNQTIIIMGEADTDTLHNFQEINNYLLSDDDSDTDLNLRQIESSVSLISTLSCALRSQSSHKGQSLRSVQFFKYFFHGGTVYGVSLNAFLLEPTRVTCKKDNFAIFYQMVHGMSDEELLELRLSRDTSYAILEYEFKGFNESHYTMLHTKMVENMTNFGITENDRKEAFKILALILHMGNIKFITNINECSIDFNDKESKIAVKNICHLLSITKNEFVKLFKYSSIKSVKVKGKIFSARNFCLSQLYGMMTNMYELLFDWIVTKINEFFTSKTDNKCETWLGVLHVSGFQYGTERNMEEFCTNYAAERMHLYFKEKYLEPEWKDYIDEGLIEQPKFLNTCDTKNVLKIIEKTIMVAFDNICSTAILPTSEHMMEKLLDGPNTPKQLIKTGQDKFLINHYAYPVQYSCSDMMCKNIGKLPNNLMTLIQSKCKNRLLQSLVTNLKDNASQSNDSDRCTTLSKLKNNLDNLLEELAVTDSYYLRCFKLERDEDAIVVVDLYNNYELKNELTVQFLFSEIYNAIKLAKKGYLVKMTHEEYNNRYIFREPGVDDIKYDLAQDIFACDKIHKLHRFVGPNIIFLSEQCFFKHEFYRRMYRSIVLKRRIVPTFDQRKKKWLAVSSENGDRAVRSDADESSEVSNRDWDRFCSDRPPIPKIENCVSCLEMGDGDVANVNAYDDRDDEEDEDEEDEEEEDEEEEDDDYNDDD
ncbi:hypothetical protein PV325_013376 [Microctonus aethiopoides]|nr:hypothetical protein PV325_013376 [Microctonus aethiopoides]